MHTAAEFLAAICANPNDDTTRLVYADWLQENGQPERAEFIRLQCEIERNPSFLAPEDDPLRRRERELWNAAVESKIAFRWFFDGFDGYLSCTNSAPRFWLTQDSTWHGELRRGFIESVACNYKDWLGYSAALCAAHPVKQVKLSDRPGVARRETGLFHINGTDNDREFFVPDAEGKTWCEVVKHILEHELFPGITFEMPDEPITLV
jgi:uncharacterized protein (TIGR02996 family)